jgi:hypothetical protein
MNLFKRLFSRDVKTNKPRLMPESKFVVTVTETEIVNQRPDGKVERVALADLKAVIIETNDSGPFGVDVLWMLLGSKSGCIVPLGCTGEAKLIAAVHDLPGFDTETFIRAMTSTTNERFVCWKANPD